MNKFPRAEYIEVVCENVFGVKVGPDSPIGEVQKVSDVYDHSMKDNIEQYWQIMRRTDSRLWRFEPETMKPINFAAVLRRLIQIINEENLFDGVKLSLQSQSIYFEKGQPKRSKYFVTRIQ